MLDSVKESCTLQSSATKGASNMFKVYKRKIHVYQLRHGVPAYSWSTNAYPTCRAAIAGAKARYPHQDFKANFAKD
jgi:hypothetical protein